MIDLNLLRQEPDRVRQALEARNVRFDFEGLLDLDRERRRLLTELETLNQQKNQANDEISRILKEKGDTAAKIASMKAISQKIADLKPQVEDLERKFDQNLLLIPNIPLKDCPIGKDATANKLVKEHKIEKKLPFKPKEHIQLGEELGILNFKRAAKLAGSSFALFTGQGAGLVRALINFMLDLHTRQHGYREVWPPLLVRRPCMEGTGQLPKFEEDMYRIYRGTPEAEKEGPQPNDLFLVPTAEVPLTNLHREETLAEEDLPLRYTAYTPCFRLEAGAYGKDTRGLVRVHQFDKVELVKFTRPEASAEEHEKLLRDSERVLELLGLPYRVLLLATGDMGFAAAKCYDLEVWAPGTGKWLETSSCSNFGDFQARRAGIKFKEKAGGKTRYVHTLNASGVALARTVIALLENGQQADGSVLIPEVLRPYMGDQTHLRRK